MFFFLLGKCLERSDDDGRCLMVFWGLEMFGRFLLIGIILRRCTTEFRKSLEGRFLLKISLRRYEQHILLFQAQEITFVYLEVFDDVK